MLVMLSLVSDAGGGGGGGGWVGGQLLQGHPAEGDREGLTSEGGIQLWYREVFIVLTS